MTSGYTSAKILIIDDDEDDFIITAEYIRAIPNSAFKIDWCSSYKEAITHLVNADYDLYFVDYRLGAKSGVDVLKEAHHNNVEEPIILLTGKGNYQVDIQAMQLGAVDYLVKTAITTEQIERSIRYALEHAATLKALRANESKYRSIFERSKDMVFVTNFLLDFKDVNKAVQTLLGYTREEILDMNLCDLIGQEQHKNILQKALLRSNEINDMEVVMSTKSGDKKYCILSVTMEENEGRNDGYLQGIVHDISNLKKMEKATLQGEKLAATGRLVRTIAHEVRNPLNNITLSVEHIQHELKDDQMQLYIDIIQRNAKRISSLISELLDTSHPSENVLQKQSLQVILDDVIAASIDRLTLKRIKLHVSYAKTSLDIMADREKLQIAILNIVINAIEAMEEYKGNLTIDLLQVGENAVLTISDNGCGIAEEHISRLFEPYFTQKRNGVGMGLTFTLNILQAHRATIDVASRIGAGTTFTISFPLAQ